MKRWRSPRTAMPPWLVQRATAVVMMVCTVIALGVAMGAAPFTYEAWYSLFSSAWVQGVTVLFALSVTWHAAIGIHDVLKDYVRPAGVRFVFLMLGYAVLATFLIRTIRTLWRVT